MGVEKISTVLRKACEWSGKNKREPWPMCIRRFAKRARYPEVFNYAADAIGGYPTYQHEDFGARSIMLGLAAAIAESEGL